MYLNITYSVCCNELFIASSGEAGNTHSGKMGFYNFRSFNDGNMVYKHSSEEFYLYQIPSGTWLVRTLIKLNTIYTPI